MFLKSIKKYPLIFLCLSFVFLFGENTLANIEKKIESIDYPRLANYYLPWSLNASQAQSLARWDFLILDMENQNNNLTHLELLKKVNPKIIVLAYVPAQELYTKVDNYNAKLRTEIIQNCQEDWYLHNQNQQRVSFWSGTHTLNLANYELWPNFLPKFVKNKILSQNIWDGVFYDNLTANISWLDANIDLNRDGSSESKFEIDKKWEKGSIKILQDTRNFNKDFILVGNSASDLDLHQYLNGRMFETFPTPWEGSGQWADSMRLYLRILPNKNLQPNVYIINANTKNTGVMDNYRQMRFGLSSTLLGDGFFSFDYGDKAHSQLWWYDEYSVLLGKSEGQAYNLLNKDNQNIYPGLWRRDFENGISLVNSTQREQTYIFQKENFEKIDGQQDRRINNGVKINWIKIAPQDGIVLLKIRTKIINNSFVNGDFVRIFDFNGQQERNGFFAYVDNYSGQVQILNIDLDSDQQEETLISENGLISVYRNGKEIFNFYPYTENFKKEINLAVADINNDGQMEIITGAGAGGGPHVRVFNNQGELINQFFAYEDDFYGGISIAIGDVNGDGNKEIVTSPGKGGKTKVRIFTQYGQLLKEFFAYDTRPDISIKVIANDIDNDNQVEILATSTNF